LLRGLLAALGCARGTTVPAETLAAVLAQLGGQPGAEPGDGEPLAGARVDAAQVQVHLARLADVLGPAAGYLTQTSAGVRLAGAGLTTDLDAVDEAVEAGRAAATAGDGSGAATALRRALARWPGPVADD